MSDISDFFLHKSLLGKQSHTMIFVLQRIHGWESALWGYLTSKADVYNFGVIAVKKNMKYKPNEDFYFIFLQFSGLCFVTNRKFNGARGYIVGDWIQQEGVRMIEVAPLCTNPSLGT